MSFKMSYSDFKELSDYVHAKAVGSSLSFEISINNKLIIKTNDFVGDQIEIVFSEEGVSYPPRISKTYKLLEEIKKK